MSEDPPLASNRNKPFELKPRGIGGAVAALLLAWLAISSGDSPDPTQHVQQAYIGPGAGFAVTFSILTILVIALSRAWKKNARMLASL